MQPYPTQSPAELNETVCVEGCDRWEIYRRLQQLSIACHCQYGQPLRVHIGDATTAIQCWSVVQQFTTSRYEQAQRLNRCWNF